MSDPFDFDHALLGELIARRWQEDPGFYALNSDGGWLEASWTPRADHSGVELHWTRRSGSHSAPELTTGVEDQFAV